LQAAWQEWQNHLSEEEETKLVIIESPYRALSHPLLAYIDTMRELYLETLKRVIGGYIRGQLLLATVISLLTGLGMALLGVPYAVFLAVLAFILEFVPIVGAVLTGVVCVAVALTQGWLMALLVLGFVVFLQALEGQILAPRILGGSVGLHPVVALLALLAGSELFGIPGALFASPVAGVLQALLIGLWSQWRESHPEQFQPEEKPKETLQMPYDGTVQSAERM
jgi:predicted PurR-regulated permease PerM